MFVSDKEIVLNGCGSGEQSSLYFYNGAMRGSRLSWQ
nr:MAG TPA: hypothetical protein [Caudoviricetes sp.]